MTKVVSDTAAESVHQRATHSVVPGPRDFVEQFISHYLRQCGYLGAKGRVRLRLRCCCREEDIATAGAYGGVLEEVDRGWHRWTRTHVYTTYAPSSSLLFFEQPKSEAGGNGHGRRDGDGTSDRR